MVLCQVYVNNADVNPSNLYTINVFGKKKVKIVKIDFKAVNLQNAPVYYNIQLQSNILRLPYGNVPYYTFKTNPNEQIGNIHSDVEFIANFNGNLDLKVVNKDTNDVPLYFVDMVLSLDISDAE
jgi:hypothetical protein